MGRGGEKGQGPGARVFRGPVRPVRTLTMTAGYHEDTTGIHLITAHIGIYRHFEPIGRGLNILQRGVLKYTSICSLPHTCLTISRHFHRFSWNIHSQLSLFSIQLGESSTSLLAIITIWPAMLNSPIPSLAPFTLTGWPSTEDIMAYICLRLDERKLQKLARRTKRQTF